jgi:LmbE family N-acetylglucosaminyl deacetylase
MADFQIMTPIPGKKVAIIVAHPDDETLWCGGTILSHPSWKCFVISLCRKNDPDRSPRFYEALKIYKAEGVMGDLDDGPEQTPAIETEVEGIILGLLPEMHFDLVITHNPAGEYTRHLRHEETGKAVINLWHTERLSTRELWTFAFEDGNKQYLPKPMEGASIYSRLTKPIWLRKYGIITETYGFGNNSFEAETTPRAESFWKFSLSYDASKWSKTKS